MRGVGTAIVLCLHVAVGCRGPVTERPALDDAGRRLIYERADRVFGAAVLVKPETAGRRETDLELAPLLLQEVEPGAPPARDGAWVVYVYAGSATLRGRRHEQRTYVWKAQAPAAQGVRVTLGSDGFPAIYEVLADSSGARLLFVSETLEGAAAGEFGDPLAGRRFAVERGVDEAPGVVVAGILEPGPMPLGPFVYLTLGSSDVAAVICRCMESRVETVVENRVYELKSIDALEFSGLALPRWLNETTSPIQLLRFPSADF